ncbi:MAG: hypothetical protein R3F11_15810 [Verrucomicrobiales bacterium]
MEALGEQAVQAGDNAAAERIYKAILAADFWNHPARGYLAAFDKLEDAIDALPVPKYAARDLPIDHLRIYHEIGGSYWTWAQDSAQFAADGQFPFSSGAIATWAPFDYFRAIVRHHNNHFDIFEFSEDFKTYKAHSLGRPSPDITRRRIAPPTTFDSETQSALPGEKPPQKTLERLTTELAAEEDLLANQIMIAKKLYTGTLEQIGIAAGMEGNEDAATHAFSLLFEIDPTNIRARAYLGIKNLVPKNRQFVPAPEDAVAAANPETLKLHAWLLGTKWGWAKSSMSLDADGYIHYANGHRSRWSPFGDRSVVIQHGSNNSFDLMVFDKTLESYQWLHFGWYKPMSWHGNGTRLTKEEAAKLAPQK